MATRAPSRSPPPSTTCSPSPPPPARCRATISISPMTPISATPEVRAFIADNNPAALAEIAARFAEALERGLWSPRVEFGLARSAAYRKGARGMTDETALNARHADKMAQEEGGARQDHRRQDHREGAADRSHRQGQGQVDRRLRHDLPLHRPWHAGRRHPVRQGLMGDRRAHRAREVPRSRHHQGDGRGLHLGNAGPRPRHRARPRRLGA